MTHIKFKSKLLSLLVLFLQEKSLDLRGKNNILNMSSVIIDTMKMEKNLPNPILSAIRNKKNIPQKILDLVYDWLIRFRTIFTVKGRTIDIKGSVFIKS